MLGLVARRWAGTVALGYGLAALGLLGWVAVRMYRAPVGYQEANHNFTAWPTAWFAVLALAVAGIALVRPRASRR
ncbi:hypothetical protein [Dactylosporangium sp. NPDC049140]|uniref:hypothetical protein n=1 Tax=Dactylosporangium sp. NPDC049140 TaxID=3155647 RepID=UPI0033C6F85C